MPASTYIKNKILDAYFGGVAYTAETPMYFGLSTATLTADDDGTTVVEPAGGSYARVSYANTKEPGGTWNYSATERVDNFVNIVFAESSADWGTMQAIFIANSGTTGAGDMLWFYNLTPTFAVGNYTTVTFPAGSIIASMV